MKSTTVLGIKTIFERSAVYKELHMFEKMRQGTIKKSLNEKNITSQMQAIIIIK